MTLISTHTKYIHHGPKSVNTKSSHHGTVAVPTIDKRHAFTAPLFTIGRCFHGMCLIVLICYKSYHVHQVVPQHRHYLYDHHLYHHSHHSSYRGLALTSKQGTQEEHVLRAPPWPPPPSHNSSCEINFNTLETCKRAETLEVIMSLLPQGKI